ncbi:MAG: hypothetical protein RL223_169 [Pseudomonadota bacterium]|jgi:hypothetical protein
MRSAVRSWNPALRAVAVCVALCAVLPARAAPPADAAASATAAASAEAPALRPAGLLKSLKGGVSLVRDGQTLSGLAPGLVLYPGDVLRTHDDGLIGITLTDDTLLAAGPNSLLVLDQVVFDATTHEGSILLRLWHGTLRVVSGLVAKRRPEAVQIQTRSVVLGVRGTDFIIDSRVLTP